MKDAQTEQLSLIDKAMSWILWGALALSPVFFLPLTQDYYDTNKWLLLVCSALLVLLLWAIKTALTGKLSITVSPLSISFFGLSIAAAVSAVFGSTNKIEAILSPLGIVTYASITLLAVLGGRADKSARPKMLLYIVSAVLALTAIYQAFGVGKIMFPGVPFLADPLWTPAGSSVALLSILMLTLPWLLGDLLASLHHTHDQGIAVTGAIGVIVVAGLVATAMKALPQLPRSMLSPLDGWSITLEVMKNIRSALVGVGVENFISAFTIGRPMRLNATDLWNIRPTANASFFLHVTATMGIFGAIATLLLLKRLWPKNVHKTTAIGLLLAIVVLLLTPPSLASLAVIGLLLSIGSTDQSRTITVQLSHGTSWYTRGWIRICVLLIVINVVATATYLVGRAYGAEYLFYRSLAAAQKNDGQTTYALQTKAKNLNPYISRYHLAFSQTSLAFANAAVQLANEQANQLDTREANRQMISQLLQQAIVEAKRAVSLAPNSVIAWENLGRVYRSMIPITKGTDAWALAAYQRALQLDPTNPILRVDVAGIYTMQQNYDLALEQFRIATALKPNYANAYYNLANTYRIQGNTDKAIEAIKKTLELVAPGSNDEVRAKAVLDELSSSKPKPTATPTPSPVPSIRLPENAGP